MKPLDRLKHHVTGAIERGEAQPISAVLNGGSESCFIERSADGKWVRIFVEGRLTVTFHAEYVRKIVGGK